tara:strand:- start:36459 stop:36821 length:363 start_codon:yes stop_codon:yes gene_type:complete
MKEAIHPDYKEIKATCSCGNVIEIKSTLEEDLVLDVCSACHPFYTGKQKLVDTGGRVDKFRKRFGKKNKASSDSMSQDQTNKQPEEEKSKVKEETGNKEGEQSEKVLKSQDEISAKETKK